LKVLLLNQCFYPDVVATAQYLTDLAEDLSARGHEVTVIASDRGYDDPKLRFPRRETWKNIRIIRIPSVSLGKNSRWQRVVNFASFLIACALRLLWLPRFDRVVALTSPPLISFLAALFVKLKGGSFCFWVMDLNPDEAIAAGWLKEKSFAARLFQWMLGYSVKQATRIVVLDRFVRDRVLAKGAHAERVTIIPPWSLDDAVGFSVEDREAFRREHGLTDRFVVMYSGNHSPCHPLDTLLAAALELKPREDVVFCFVGGGSEQKKVNDFAACHDLPNIKVLPYQPLHALSGSLSAADLHVVVMGDAFVGIVHPCKIYNIMSVGAPVLYIGPESSHVTDLAVQHGKIFLTSHGDVSGVTGRVLLAREQQARASGEGEFSEGIGRGGERGVLEGIGRGDERGVAEGVGCGGERGVAEGVGCGLRGVFSKQTLLPQLVNAIGGTVVENVFRALPDSDNSLTDYHAAH
jgi:glycosyltransferase involved in cell wall biosynthesis